MKIKNIVWMMAVGWLLGACTADDDAMQGRRDVPIRLGIALTEPSGANVRATTRTASSYQNTELIAGEAVDVYIKNASTSVWIANPLACTVSGNGGDLTSASTLYYPYDGSSVSMYAVHPSVASGATFIVSADQTSDANYAQSDLTFSKAATYAYSTTVQTLSMAHLMSQIVVNITLPSAWAGRAITNLKLHAKRSTVVTYPVDNSDGYTLSAASGDGEISFSVGGAVLIPPQTITSGSAFISFNIPGVGPYVYRLPADRTFEAGKQYVYNLTPQSASLSYETTLALRLLTGGNYTHPISNTGSSQVVYTSSNTSVATVNSITGLITPVAVGNTIITATIPSGQDNFYTTKTASYKVIVYSSTPVLGKVIAQNSYTYGSVSDAMEAGTTASGIIAHYGAAGSADASSSTYKCLVIALADASRATYWCGYTNLECTSDGGGNASTAIGYKNGLAATNALISATSHSHQAAYNARNYTTAPRPSGASAWFLPAAGQWNLMVKGLTGGTANLTTSENATYSSTKVNAKIIAAGATGLNVSTAYWASTQAGTSHAWYYAHTVNGGRVGYASKTVHTNDYAVRAVFAY